MHVTWRNSLPWAVEGTLILAIFAFAIGQHLWIEQSLRHQQEILAPAKTVASATTGSRIYADNDSYTWLTLAKESIATRSRRINFTHADNTPYGRDVHWCSALVWLLVAAGSLRSAVTGEPIYTAVENAGFFVNLFQLLFIMGFWIVVMRKPLGRWATLAGLSLMVLLPENGSTFFPGRPDHQTFHFLAALGVPCLLLRGGLGWVSDGNVAGLTNPCRTTECRSVLRYVMSLCVGRIGNPPILRTIPNPATFVSDGKTGSSPFFTLPDRRSARICFQLAGVLSAFGLWAGATVQLAVFGLVGIAMAFLFVWVRQKTIDGNGGSSAYEPDLWWHWAATGSVFTIVFYLLQYFPGNLAMRLEAIHPAYAISWAGAGWLLAVAAKWMIHSISPNPRDWRIWLALVAMLVFPLLTLLGPVEWHCMRDPVPRRFQLATTEGLPFWEFYHNRVSGSLWRMFSSLPVLLLALPFMARCSRLQIYERASLIFCAILTASFVLMTYYQVRWAMFASLMFVLSASVCVAAARRLFRWRWQSFVLILACLAGVVPLARTAISDVRDRWEGRTLDAGLLYSLWPHRIAKALREAVPKGELRTLSRPEFASGLYYFGGIESVGSVFWQNKPGLADSMAFFLATDPAEAKEIAFRRGVDFVVVYQIDNPDLYLRIRYGNNPPDSPHCLLQDLASQKPPSFDWLQFDEKLSSLMNPGTGSLFEQRILAHVFRVRPASASGGESK